MRRRSIEKMRHEAAKLSSAIADQIMADAQDRSPTFGGIAAQVMARGCPKCGKVYPRGLHLHVKHCKG